MVNGSEGFSMAPGAPRKTMIAWKAFPASKIYQTPSCINMMNWYPPPMMNGSLSKMKHPVASGASAYFQEFSYHHDEDRHFLFNPHLTTCFLMNLNQYIAMFLDIHINYIVLSHAMSPWVCTSKVRYFDGKAPPQFTSLTWSAGGPDATYSFAFTSIPTYKTSSSSYMVRYVEMKTCGCERNTHHMALYSLYRAPYGWFTVQKMCNVAPTSTVVCTKTQLTTCSSCLR